MGDTSISWTDKTWNPIRGCSRVSEGCRNCYAEAVAARFSGKGQPYHGLAVRRTPKLAVTNEGGQPHWTGEVRMIEEHLLDPMRWRKPARIFVNSMSDLFHEKLATENIDRIFGVMALAPQHTFQVLTKRAARMRAYFTHENVWARIEVAARKILFDETGKRIAGKTLVGPMPHVWLGVSTEDQATYVERAHALHGVPAAVHFISAEPLLGPIDLSADSINPGWLDWVIVGCESGHRARLCEADWIRGIRDQCATHDVPLFVKQARPIDGASMLTNIRPIPLIRGRLGEIIPIVGEGPGSKEKGGGVIELPYLDGVQHAAMPKRREPIADLIARSSIGAGLANIKENGLDAELEDLDRELHPRSR